MYGQYIIIIIIVIVIIIIIVIVIIIIIVIVIIIYSGSFYKKSVVGPTSKNTRKRKLKAPADQASPSSEECIPGTPLKSPFQPRLLTLSSSWSSTGSPFPRRSPRHHLDTPESLVRGKL